MTQCCLHRFDHTLVQCVAWTYPPFVPLAPRREQHPDGTDPLTGEPDRGAEASAALAEASDPVGILPVPLRD